MLRTVVSEVLTLAGLGVLGFLIGVRRDIAANLGGAGMATVALGTAMVANVASLLLVGRSSALLGVSALILLAYAVLQTGRSTVPGGPDPARRRSWVVVGLLILWSASVDLAVGPGIVGGRLPAYLGGVLVWVAVGLIAGSSTGTIRGICYVGLALLSAMTIPTVLLDTWWTTCHVGDLDKCSFVGSLFRGPAKSENYIAILASLTAISAQVSFRGRTRILVFAYCALVLACTGSRTGLLTVAFTSAYCLLADRWDRRRPQRRLSVLVAVTISSTAAIFAMYQIFSAARGTLSRRGTIWIAVREAIDGSLLTGVGVSKWTALQSVGQSPQHFFHSTYALFLFAGGAISVGLFWLWSYFMLRGVAADGRARSCSALVVLVLAYSQTEVIWNPLAVDGLTWVYLLLTCTGLAARPLDVRSRERPDTGPTVTGPGARDPVRTGPC